MSSGNEPCLGCGKSFCSNPTDLCERSTLLNELVSLRAKVASLTPSESEMRGRRINRKAWLGSQIVSLKERIPALEKLARKTPPKTLLTEWDRVKQAKVQLESARAQLAEYENELKGIET